jgi:hypothetical protein
MFLDYERSSLGPNIERMGPNTSSFPTLCDQTLKASAFALLPNTQQALSSFTRRLHLGFTSDASNAFFFCTMSRSERQYGMRERHRLL